MDKRKNENIRTEPTLFERIFRNGKVQLTTKEENRKHGKKIQLSKGN